MHPRGDRRGGDLVFAVSAAWSGQRGLGRWWTALNRSFLIRLVLPASSKLSESLREVTCLTALSSAAGGLSSLPVDGSPIAVVHTEREALRSRQVAAQGEQHRAWRPAVSAWASPLKVSGGQVRGVQTGTPEVQDGCVRAGHLRGVPQS